MTKKIIVLMLIISSFLLTGCDKKFSLNENYYKKAEFTEIEKEEYEKLIKDKESFGMFIYQPLCTTSYNFNKVVTKFMNMYNVSFYKMSFANMKETNLKSKIKYYPSFAIFKDGELVDSLDANSEEDTNIYKSVDYFAKWFSSYVKVTLVNEDVQVNEVEEEKERLKIDANLENLKYDENKVNIYFFWGNGCPHCEKEFEFFESIKTEYGDYFTLNTFETWYDEDNREILKQFASNMEDEITGVPYTIIGNKSFKGFSERYEEEMLKAIKEQYKNSDDVYFDNIDSE